MMREIVAFAIAFAIATAAGTSAVVYALKSQLGQAIVAQFIGTVL